MTKTATEVSRETTLVNTLKKATLKHLLTALRISSNVITGLELTDGGNAVIIHIAGTMKRPKVNISGDSCSAMMYDLFRSGYLN